MKIKRQLLNYYGLNKIERHNIRFKKNVIKNVKYQISKCNYNFIDMNNAKYFCDYQVCSICASP